MAASAHSLPQHRVRAVHLAHVRAALVAQRLPPRAVPRPPAPAAVVRHMLDRMVAVVEARPRDEGGPVVRHRFGAQKVDPVRGAGEAAKVVVAERALEEGGVGASHQPVVWVRRVAQGGDKVVRAPPPRLRPVVATRLHAGDEPRRRVSQRDEEAARPPR